MIVQSDALGERQALSPKVIEETMRLCNTGNRPHGGGRVALHSRTQTAQGLVLLKPNPLGWPHGEPYHWGAWVKATEQHRQAFGIRCALDEHQVWLGEVQGRPGEPIRPSRQAEPIPEQPVIEQQDTNLRPERGLREAIIQDHDLEVWAMRQQGPARLMSIGVNGHGHSGAVMDEPGLVTDPVRVCRCVW